MIKIHIEKLNKKMIKMRSLKLNQSIIYPWVKDTNIQFQCLDIVSDFKILDILRDSIYLWVKNKPYEDSHWTLVFHDNNKHI